MTDFQKGTNDRPQNEAGTFALRLAVEKTETIGPSDHANQRNQVTRPGPGAAGPRRACMALQEHRVLGPGWYDSGQAGRASKPFTAGWIGKVKTPWTADRAMTTVAWLSLAASVHQCRQQRCSTVHRGALLDVVVLL